MKPWRWFQSLNEQYGPVVYLQMGRTLTIIIAGPTHLNVMEPATGSIIVRSLPNISPEPQKGETLTCFYISIQPHITSPWHQPWTLLYSVWALVLRIHNTSPADVTFATRLPRATSLSQISTL
jgi:hypothetical protein